MSEMDVQSEAQRNLDDELDALLATVVTIKVYEKASLQHLAALHGDPYHEYRLTGLQIVRQAQADRRLFKDYAHTHTFSEIVVQMTLGSLFKLVELSSVTKTKRVRHLLLVVDVSEFSRAQSPVRVLEALQTSLHNLLYLRTITIKFRNYCTDVGRVSGKTMSMVHVLGRTPFRCLRHIYLELPHPDFLHDIYKFCVQETDGPSGKTNTKTKRKWKLSWKSLRALHISLPCEWLDSNREYSSGFGVKPDGVFADRDHNSSWRGLVRARPYISTMSISKSCNCLPGVRQTVLLEHTSSRPASTKSLLDSIRGLQVLRISWQSADADTLIRLINTNYNTLRKATFDVSLQQPGNWHGIFRALQKSPLLDIAACGRGLRYCSPDGPVQTGYLVRGQKLSSYPILRWLDRYCLSALLTEISARRTAAGMSDVEDVSWYSVMFGSLGYHVNTEPTKADNRG